MVTAFYGVHTSNNAIYNQSIVNGKPSLQFPYPFPADLAAPDAHRAELRGDIQGVGEDQGPQHHPHRNGHCETGYDRWV